MVSFTAMLLKDVGRSAFRGCQCLESIFLPKATKIGMATSNQSITDGVFQDCFSLKSIVLPLITEVSATCFSGCSAAEYISLPSVTTAGLPQDVFIDCTNLKWINIRSTAPVGNMSSYRNDVCIPPSCGVTCLNGEVSLPNGETDPAAFKLLDMLNYNENYISGVKSGTTLPKTLLECYAEGIGKNAFQGRAEVETAILPNVMFTIGENAFKDCANLRQVILPRKLLDGDDSSFKIESNAFTNCPKLKYLELTNATMD